MIEFVFSVAMFFVLTLLLVLVAIDIASEYMEHLYEQKKKEEE